MTKSAKSQVDVVVIGAGIVGCSTAYYLSKRGAKVALIEKGEVAGEQSSRAWGWVRQQGRNPREIPLSIFSKGLWSELSSEINADVEWIEDGSLKLAYTEEEMAHFESWAKEARDLGLDTRVISASEVKELVPALEGPFLGGVYTPSDGQAEPRKGTEAMARAAEENGAELYSHRSVEGFRVEGGVIKEVLTDQGGIEADSVVCAAGAWSSQLGRMVGVHLPQRVVKGTVVCTEPSEIVSHITVMSPDVTFRQKRDGTFYLSNGLRSDYYVNRDSFRDLGLFLRNYLRFRRNMKVHIGGELVKDLMRGLPWSSAQRHPFAHTVDIEPEPNGQHVRGALRSLENLIPSIGALGIKRTWAGMIDASPDATPVIGEAPEVKGFYFATCFSGHGFALGPGAGLLMSELILDGKTSIDIRPFRPSRFREGDMADWTKTI